jgi:hypothetical protein
MITRELQQAVKEKQELERELSEAGPPLRGSKRKKSSSNRCWRRS